MYKVEVNWGKVFDAIKVTLAVLFMISCILVGIIMLYLFWYIASLKFLYPEVIVSFIN